MYPRFVEECIRAACADTRVILIVGPRQSGKTTLAQRFANDQRQFLSLDDTTILAAARADPVGFIRGLDFAIIDEIQRAPELILAIKQSVDTDRRPGRFILTGSADLMTLPHVADSLAGRMEIVRLLPLAQSELRKQRSMFMEAAFRFEIPTAPKTALVGDDLVAMVLAGGYPEALHRATWRRRQRWHLDYIDAIVQRDVRDIAQIEHVQQMPQLIRVLAQHAAQLINYSAMGAPLGMSHVTTRKYAGILEQLFLTVTLAPWYTNRLKRLTKTPKVHFLDAGLLATLCDLTPERIRVERKPWGAVLETFVLSELLKLASWSEDRFDFFHFRDKEKHEVDVVIEDHRGRVIGIEVKASATVVVSDFRGLRRLAKACGDRFVAGMVLYDHEVTVPFGDRMFAMPLAVLWGVVA